MKTRVGAWCVFALVGGAGILGCGSSANSRSKDAGTSADVPVSSGGTVGTGGLVGTGGQLGRGGDVGTGGAVGTGGRSATGGSSTTTVVPGTTATGGRVTGGAAGSGRGGAEGTGGRTGTTPMDASPADGANACTDLCALYGEACCLWTDPCLAPSGTCTFDVLAASAGTTYEYEDLEAKLATLPKDISASFTDQDIAWAAADPAPAGRMELHLTDAAASQYGTILDGARDGRVFRISCGGQSLFVGVFYLIYGAAALGTPVMHEARESGVLVLRLGAYQSAWYGMGLTSPSSIPLRERIDRAELRAALCRRGVMHVLDPDAKPANP